MSAEPSTEQIERANQLKEEANQLVKADNLQDLEGSNFRGSKSQAETMLLAMCCPSEEFEKEHPVAAQTIKCFWIGLGTSGSILVYLAAPIVTIILVFVRKISPWWLFLGCGPFALMSCASCCVLGYVVCGCFLMEFDKQNSDYYYERSRAEGIKNKPIPQSATV
ncbi:hypothetical protein DdX_12609 [Ditylenchus destructor]|uniref:Uncharacterized protein n=1 Tax=Ditylenchus destructor TaxID=166010 RepID=A0AAD4R3K6_9BILA|nr:hypothetical protein DdX_12609 [Ditylenchus destructor]